MGFLQFFVVVYIVCVQVVICSCVDEQDVIGCGDWIVQYWYFYGKWQFNWYWEWQVVLWSIDMFFLYYFVGFQIQGGDIFSGWLFVWQVEW